MTDIITRSEWRKKHRDFKTGDPRKGTAKMLKYCDGLGTCLVPVTVIPDGSAIEQAARIVWRAASK